MHAWDRNSRTRAPDGQAGHEIIIRDAQDSDSGALLDLWRELMDLHVELDDRFTLSENADQRFFSYLETAQARNDYRVRLALIEGEAAGFSISCVLPNSPVYRARWIGYINDLCVTQTKRGLGIGRALVADAVAWLRVNGAETVEVYVSHENNNAQRFWRSMGGQEYLERLSLDLSQYSSEF